MHLCLNLDLNLNLNLGPYPALNRAPFQKPLEKPNPALFGWLYGFRCLLLYDMVNLARYLQVQQGERSVGRPLPERIVVAQWTSYYMWWTGIASGHSPIAWAKVVLPRGAPPGTRIGIAAFTSALTSALSREFSPRLTALLISRLKA